MQDGIVDVVLARHALHHLLLRDAGVGRVGKVVEGAEVEDDGVGEVAGGVQQHELLEARDGRADLLHVQRTDGQVVHRNRQVAAVGLRAQV